jgi:hypothetical protein
MHRQNLPELPEIVDLAVEMRAERIEVANVQYYGWALKNRQALMPTFEQLKETTAFVEAARVRLKGILNIDYVIPDYYAKRPKQCMGGWGGSSSTSRPRVTFCPAMPRRRSPG